MGLTMNKTINLCLKLYIPLACLGLSGCALGVEQIEIAYQQQSAAAPVEGASNAPVDLRITTASLPRPERVGVKKNGYGMELGGIAPSRPIADIVRDSFTTELTQRGFPLMAGGQVFDVDVIKFANDFKMGFFTADAVAEVTLVTVIRGKTGQILFTKTVNGRGKSETLLLMIPSEARKALVLALSDAVHTVVSDPEFTRALLQTSGRVS